MTPALSGGPVGEVSLRIGPASVGMGGRWLAPVEGNRRGGAVQADLGLMDLTGCAWLRRYGLCGFAAIGLQGAEGDAFAVNRSGDAFFLAAGLRGVADWDLTPHLFLRGGAELWVPLSVTRLRVDGEVVWETAPVGVGLLLGGGARL